MVNLLFISNSSKMDAVKNALQPLLKVKIDVVADFDYGLKDVFEKRPATVFIQDQIAGVTGESVARHIQMLLGNGAPSFIFMHDGGSSIKPINGLFEYLVDLSQAEVKIVVDIQATLKSLLGAQWEKINIPPKIDMAAIRNAVAVPERNRVIADQLVDEFLSDLDNVGSVSADLRNRAIDFSETTAPMEEPFLVVSSSQEQLAEMYSETSRAIINAEATDVAADKESKNNPAASLHRNVSTVLNQQQVMPKQSEPTLSMAAHAFEQPQPIQREITSSVPVLPTKSDEVSVSSCSQTVTEKPPLQQVSPADFIINGEESPAEDLEPEDLLHIFEDNYSHSGGWRRYVFIFSVLTLCAGGGIWYLLKQKPHLLTFLSKPSVQSVVVAPTKRLSEPLKSIQKPVPAQLQKATAPVLPAFIPQAGLDSSFSSLKPGWDRYVDTILEFRVYRVAGKIKALQVMGVKNNVISESKLKSILFELTGDGDYRVKSSEQKLGYHVSRALVGQKNELLIYRKKTTIRAFVVSLD